MPDSMPFTQPDHLPPVRLRVRHQPTQAAASQPDPADRAGPGSPDYEVGYGRPPRHTRFTPGRSGNPKGRPKAAKSLNTIVRESMTQKVAVRTAAGERKMSRIEAVMHKAVEQAMKGYPRAIAELLRLYGNAIPDERASDAGSANRADDLTAADLAILDALREELADEREHGDDVR